MPVESAGDDGAVVEFGPAGLADSWGSGNRSAIGGSDPLLNPVSVDEAEDFARIRVSVL